MTDYSLLKTMGVIEAKPVTSVIGKKEPIAHPTNCRIQCSYGTGKTFCYPCMKLILAEHKESKVIQANKEDPLGCTE